MASNLITARSLIQADLDHARSVLGLWTHQVEELQKALDQIDAVSHSRNALRVQYQGGGAPAPALEAPAVVPEKPRRGRKPADRSAIREAKSGKSGKAAPALKSAAKPVARHAAKFKDPNSEKTWSGLGRRPGWLVGAPDQYAIHASGKNSSNAARGSAAVENGGESAAS